MKRDQVIEMMKLQSHCPSLGCEVAAGVFLLVGVPLPRAPRPRPSLQPN
jgi:hypothetical protein